MARPSDPERREAILQAARAVFLEEGYTNARMASIATRAGVASGTVYLYFPSKEALAMALADDFFVRLTDALAPRLQQLDSADAIAAAVRAALAFAMRDHDLLRLLHLTVGLSLEARPVPARRALEEMLAATLAGHMAAGRVRRYDPRVLAELLTGIIEWVAEATVLREVADYRPYEVTVIALLQHALLPEPV
jgi:AcrR family transcriptional regulator